MQQILSNKFDLKKFELFSSYNAPKGDVSPCKKVKIKS